MEGVRATRICKGLQLHTIALEALPDKSSNHLPNQKGDVGALMLTEAVMMLVWFGTCWLLGKLVIERGWNPSYTRKLLTLALLAAPYLLQKFLAVPSTAWANAVGFACGLICLLPFEERRIESSRFLTVAFAAFDRPEDRPFTTQWLISGYLVSSAILLAMMMLLPAAQQVFVAIALFAAGIGDTLAGAIGLRFGERKYATTALFTDRTYTRSYLGSACMFISVAGCLFWLAPDVAVTVSQFLIALLILPPLVTWAEAKSPHTWDEAFIFAACGIVGVLCAISISANGTGTCFTTISK